MARIPKYYVRPDGLHESIIRINGKRKAFRGKTDTEVYNKIKAYSRETASEAQEAIFDIAADAWWVEIEPTLEHNTAKSYRPAYQRAKVRFGKYTVSSITAKEIDTYIKDFSATRSRKTVVTQLQIIRQILRKAELDGIISYNPAPAVKPPRNLPQKRRSTPSKEEITLIKNSKECPFGLFAYLIYHTGCRRGEALALQGNDIDRKSKLVHITKSIYHVSTAPKIKLPKTESGARDVPLLDALDASLPKKLPKGYLFSLDGGKTPLRSGDVTRLYKAYEKASGLTVTPHQIRHAYATALFENGVDPKTAQALLGHAQISTTMDIYTHVCSDIISEAAKKMNLGF